MDKNTFNTYGGVIVLTIILVILVTFASPFGLFLKDSFFLMGNATEIEATKLINDSKTIFDKEHRVSIAPVQNGVVTTPYYTDFEGDKVEFEATPSDGYRYAGAEIEYGGHVIILEDDETSFIMPTDDVVIVASFVNN